MCSIVTNYMFISVYYYIKFVSNKRGKHGLFQPRGTSDHIIKMYLCYLNNKREHKTYMIYRFYMLYLGDQIVCQLQFIFFYSRNQIVCSLSIYKVAIPFLGIKNKKIKSFIYI